MKRVFRTELNNDLGNLMGILLKSIYKDKNNNKFKNKLVKAFRNMHLQYYIDIHKFCINMKICVCQYSTEDAYCEKLLLICF